MLFPLSTGGFHNASLNKNEKLQRLEISIFDQDPDLDDYFQSFIEYIEVPILIPLFQTLNI